jgi:hypothetical protein
MGGLMLYADASRLAHLPWGEYKLEKIAGHLVARHSNGALYLVPEIECKPAIHAVRMPADCGELPGAS